MTDPKDEEVKIARPSVWRLALLADGGALTAVAHSTVEDSSLRVIRAGRDEAAPSQLKSVEDAVYAHPWLLSGFGRTDVIVRSDSFAVVPPELDVSAVGADLLSFEAAAEEPSEIIADTAGPAAIVWTAPAALLSFFRRTFPNCHFRHHLTPLLQYFSRQTDLGNSGKVYVHFHDCAAGATGEADVLVFARGGHLVFANTFRYRTTDDAVYFVLGAARLSGINLADDRIMLCGDAAAREKAATALRRFANYVMPVIFPSSMYRAGRDAINAPFPLIILPLCE